MCYGLGGYLQIDFQKYIFIKYNIKY